MHRSWLPPEFPNDFEMLGDGQFDFDISKLDTDEISPIARTNMSQVAKKRELIHPEIFYA